MHAQVVEVVVNFYILISILFIILIGSGLVAYVSGIGLAEGL